MRTRQGIAHAWWIRSFLEDLLRHGSLPFSFLFSAVGSDIGGGHGPLRTKGAVPLSVLTSPLTRIQFCLFFRL